MIFDDKEFVQSDIDEINKELDELESENFRKNIDTINIHDKRNRIITLLKEQRVLVAKHILSTDKNERRKLFYSFLEKESLAYDIYFYKQFSNMEKSLHNIEKHLSYLVWYYILRILKFFFNNLTLSFSIFIFIGVLCCMPYFMFYIGKVPQIDTNQIMPSLFIAAIYGVYYFLTILTIILSQSGYTFYVYKYKSIIGKTFLFVWLFLVFIILIPYMVKFNMFIDIVEFIAKYTNEFLYLLVLYVFLFLAIYLFLLNKYRNINSIVPAFAYLILDLILILVVYIKYNDIHPVILCIFIFLLFAIRLIAAYYIEYRTISCLSIAVATIFMIFISPSLVREAGLANYYDNYTIKNEFINKLIMEIPYCINNYNETCIDKQSSDNNKTKFNNLLFRVKSDDKYYFRAFIKDGDYNTTQKIDFSSDYGCKLDMNKIVCYSVNDNNSTVMRVIVENIKDKSVQFDETIKKYFIDFEVKTSNILN